MSFTAIDNKTQLDEKEERLLMEERKRAQAKAIGAMEKERYERMSELAKEGLAAKKTEAEIRKENHELALRMEEEERQRRIKEGSPSLRSRKLSWDGKVLSPEEVAAAEERKKAQAKAIGAMEKERLERMQERATEGLQHKKNEALERQENVHLAIQLAEQERARRIEEGSPQVRLRTMSNETKKGLVGESKEEVEERRRQQAKAIGAMERERLERMQERAEINLAHKKAEMHQRHESTDLAIKLAEEERQRRLKEGLPQIRTKLPAPAVAH